jgi:restriction system protein
VVAVAGAVLLVLGAAATGPTGTVVIVLGCGALVLAGVAGLGARGAKECEAFQRSGMAAVDTMNGRQFQFLLEHLFAKKGYRVARLRVREDSGADLLLDLPHGRTIVQVQHWNGMVRHEAVHQAVVAKTRYGVARALVVTSSNYSADAVAEANSNGVTLWNRAFLAAELSSFRADSLPSGPKRFSADVRAGSLITLGFLATLVVALGAASARARSRVASTRRRGDVHSPP